MNTGLIYTFDPYEHHPWRHCVRRMYEDGVRTFSYLMPLVLAWREDGAFDFTGLDGLHEELRSLAPEAKFLPRVFMTAPDWWDRLHPDELMRFTGTEPLIPRFDHENQKLWRYETKMYHAVNNASMASLLWRRDASRALAAWLEHADETHFPLAGAMPVYGTCGEWGQFGSYRQGFFGNADSSWPMTLYFREFLREKYLSGDALKSAWRDETVSFDTVGVPTKLERMATEKGAFRSMRFYQRCLDYFEAFSRVKAEAIDDFCAVVKNHDPELVTGTFGGALMQVGASAYTLHSGQTYRMLEMLLRNTPHVDFISTPNVYYNRTRGIFSQAPAEAVARHKYFIAECDVRTELAGDAYSPRAGASRDQFVMELGYNLCCGSGELWLYDFGRGWYADESIRSVVRSVTREWNKLPRGSAPDGGGEIAFVVSEESVSLGEGNIGFYRMANELLYSELPRCGCRFEVMLQSEVCTRPPCKLYIFRDTFFIRDGEIVSLRAFLKRNQSSAIWLGGAGCIAPEAVCWSRSEKLTTFELNAVPELCAPVSLTLTNREDPLFAGRALPEALAGVEKLESMTTPVLYAVNVTEKQTLALIESLDLPGMTIRRDGGRFDLWSATPQLDAGLLARLAGESGIKAFFRHQTPVSCYGTGPLRTLRFDRTGSSSFDGTLRDILSGDLYCGIIRGNAGDCFLVEVVS